MTEMEIFAILLLMPSWPDDALFFSDLIEVIWHQDLLLIEDHFPQEKYQLR